MWTEMALPLQAGGLPNATQAFQDSSVSPPKPARPGSVEVLLQNRAKKNLNKDISLGKEENEEENASRRTVG